MSKRIPTFYVLHGPDEFSCRAQLHAMRAQMGDPSMAELNITVLEGKTASAADVLSAARSMPFLSDKRLVIVEGMLTWRTRKGASKNDKAEMETLAEGLSDLPDWARVVFVERETLSDKNLILHQAKTLPGSYHKEFNPPRNTTQWLITHAREEYGTDIDRQAAMALAAVIGEDLRAADSEIAKLSAYVGSTRPISEADIRLLTSYQAEVEVFDMVDALGRRDGATASRLLHQLLEQDEPLRLFALIIRQFRLLILAREHLNNGGTAGQLAQAIGVPPFIAEKIAGQVRAFSLEQLEQIYHFLLDTDSGIKTGKVDDILALDLLVAGISS